MTAEVSEKVRRIVLDRATPEWAGAPLCEAMLPGCESRGAEIHHRAGRGKDPRLCGVSAVLLLCRTCHAFVTQHYCYDAGFSVRRQRDIDPAVVPVCYRGGASVYLAADGRLCPVDGDSSPSGPQAVHDDSRGHFGEL